MPSNFGDLLRRHRRTAGLTQEELAERSHLSVDAVTTLERGVRRVPRRDTVVLLADALALDPEARAAFVAAARQASIAAGSSVAGATAAEGPARSPRNLPAGTVTFLFTDIEASTRLLQRLGPVYGAALAQHQALLHAAFAAHGGVEVDTQGDSFFAAFAAAPQALAAAAGATRALADHAWPQDAVLRVRIGLHTGTPQLVGDHYVGLDVHRAARIAAAGHGGQVLLSDATEALVREQLPEGAVLRDLGLHRLKDLQHVEHLYQLVLPALPDLPGLPSDFPPLKTLDTRPHNLPVQPTPVLGRETELAVIAALVRRDDVRLVTLTGPGGIGKTRLAMHVAAEVLDDFADGVWFVRLSRLVDPSLVVPTIAQTLGLQEQGSQPIGETVAAYLHDKQQLLVLDNFEQVVGAAPVVATLLASSPGLRVLVTSRVSLHVYGEREYPLAPLSLPDPRHLPAPERLSQYAAVALFLERAQAARPDFAVTAANAPAIAEICARLDGLPLAIELAAARVKLLPPPALLARLSSQLTLLTGGPRDREERQQTMRATIAWSEGLLSAAERVLFRRLAVFVGGCTLEAAEAVCAAPELGTAGIEPLELDVLDGLSRLVDHSLVQQRTAGTVGTVEETAREEAGEPRFGMLQVIREYALERLEASAGSAGGTEVETLRRAHAAYYVAFAERAWSVLLGSVDGDDYAAAHVQRVRPEQDNLRTALAWLRAQAEAPKPTGRMGRTERAGSGRATTSRTAMRRRGEAAVVQGLRLAGALVWFWAYSGQLDEGRAWLAAFLDLATPLVGAAGSQAEHGGGASATAPRGRRTRAARSADETFLRGRALYGAGVLAYWQGDSAQAIPPLEQSLTIFQALGDRRSAAFALNNLGMALKDQGDLARARACYEQCLALGRALGEPTFIGRPLSKLSSLALAAGDVEQAAQYSEEALAIGRQISDYTLTAVALSVQALIARLRGHLRQAARLAAEALVLHRAFKDERHYGDGLELCAIILASQGRAEQAARLLGAAAASRERIGMHRPMEVPTAADIEAAAAAARAALGEAAWAAAYAAGRALSLQEAIAEALETTQEQR